MTAFRSTTHPLFRGPRLLGLLRRVAVRWMVLTLLLLTQVPLLAAVMLAMGNAESDHEFRACYDQGRIEVTLHHAAQAGRAHRHTGLESVLMDDGGEGHPDHVISFGSSSPVETSPVEDAPVPTVSLVPVVTASPDSLVTLDAPASVRVFALSPPCDSRRGVVMRL